MTFSITQKGEELDPSKYTWDPKTKTLSTNENNLVLDFSEYSNFTFKTGSDCTFNTGSSCSFTTGYSCTIKTYYDSEIKVEKDCCIHRFDTNEVWLLSNTTIKTKEKSISGHYTEEEIVCKDIIE